MTRWISTVFAPAGAILMACLLASPARADVEQPYYGGYRQPPRAAAAPDAPLMTAARTVYRQQVRSLPITARPNRVGHVYGNTVRRLNRLQAPPLGESIW